jgi:hypothetical protein
LKKDLENISFLTTLIVENFFSTVRAKVRYPNLWQYATYYYSATNELVKKLLGPERGYSLPDTSFGLKYDTVAGLKLDKSALLTISPSEKERRAKKMPTTH